MFNSQDEFWMQQALAMAKKASDQGEVPVGAVLVLENELIARAHNAPISHEDPTAHAEILALRLGAKKLKNYRLLDTTLYVTLEPCMMCAGAIVHARIGRLVYGAFDEKAGAITSCQALLEAKCLNHRVVHQGGLLKEACGALLSEFFKQRRNRFKLCI